MPTEQVWAALLGPLGTLVLALLIIVAFLKGWIVAGWVYKDLARERDRLFQLAVPAVRGLEQGATALKESREAGFGRGP